jgi:predicted transcriptional regulator
LRQKTLASEHRLGILPAMSPPALSAVELEHDPVWAAAQAAPLSDEPETEEERAAFEEGMADIRAGRVVSRDAILATIERMRIEQGE